MSKLFQNKYNLSVQELQDLHTMYQVHCTAEYILENHNISEDKAIELGVKVRALMDKYNMDEDVAIVMVLREENI